MRVLKRHEIVDILDSFLHLIGCFTCNDEIPRALRRIFELTNLVTHSKIEPCIQNVGFFPELF